MRSRRVCGLPTMNEQSKLRQNAKKKAWKTLEKCDGDSLVDDHSDTGVDCILESGSASAADYLHIQTHPEVDPNKTLYRAQEMVVIDNERSSGERIQEADESIIS